MPSTPRTSSLLGRFPLLAGHRVAGAAVGRVERQHVVLPEAGQRAVQHRLHAETLADLARGVVRQPLLGRPLHQPQLLGDPVVGHDVEERRLAELHLQRHGQRLVEHRVAGAVLEAADQEADRDWSAPAPAPAASGAIATGQGERPAPRRRPAHRRSRTRRQPAGAGRSSAGTARRHGRVRRQRPRQRSQILEHRRRRLIAAIADRPPWRAG